MSITLKLLAAAMIASAAGSGSANASNVTIAGGELNSSVTNSDVYLGVPESGKVPPGKACQMAKKYVDYINAGRYADVAELFAEDAVVMEPMRMDTRGRKLIHDFYERTIGKMTPEIVAVAYTGDDTDCMVALTAKIGADKRYRLTSVDHFTLNAAGKFSRMVAFIRPQS